MSDKAIVMFTMSVGSGLGSYLPSLTGADWLSPWSIIGGLVGGVLGIWAGYKLINL